MVDGKANSLSLVRFALPAGLGPIGGLAVNALWPFVDAGAKDSEILILIVDYRWPLSD